MVMQQTKHKALGRAEILRLLSSFDGITTADGNAGGTTLFCSQLIGTLPTNDFITNKVIYIDTGARASESQVAAAFNPLTGQITISPAFSGQILAGVHFYVLNAASGGGSGGASQGLSFYGVVTDVPGANQFTIASLTGIGDTAFVNWGAFVFWDAGGAGAAPQQETQTVTAYVSATGTFTTGAFTAPVAVGDKIILLNPGLVSFLNNFLKLRRSSQAGNYLMAAGWTVVYTQSDTSPFMFAGADIDLTNMQAGDIINIRIRKQLDNTGTWLVKSQLSYIDQQPATHPVITIDPFPVVYGVEIAMQQTAGPLRIVTVEPYDARK